MQVIAELVSGRRYCGSSVVGSLVWLSSTEPNAKNAGHPFVQPLSFASAVGVLLLCWKTAYAPVDVADFVNVGKSDALPTPVCADPSGWSVKLLCASCVPVALKSVPVIVVDENCDAFTKPMFVRYWSVLRMPVTKILSRPTVEAVSETKLYQGMPENNWPVVGAVFSAVASACGVLTE